MTGEGGGVGGRGPALLRIARSSILEALGRPRAPREPGPAWLERPAATFVTLKIAGKLRGCIGSLEPHRPLGEDVRANALAAALEDPRFPPLTAAEADRMTLEVSLLSDLTAIPFAGEADLLAALRPGIDGVCLVCGSHRGIFLPQVWKQLPDPRRFLDGLKRKAGLAGDFWAPDVEAWRFSVEKWSEPAPAEALEP